MLFPLTRKGTSRRSAVEAPAGVEAPRSIRCPSTASVSTVRVASPPRRRSRPWASTMGTCHSMTTAGLDTAPAPRPHARWRFAIATIGIRRVATGNGSATGAGSKAPRAASPSSARASLLSSASFTSCGLFWIPVDVQMPPNRSSRLYPPGLGSTNQAGGVAGGLTSGPFHWNRSCQSMSSWRALATGTPDRAGTDILRRTRSSSMRSVVTPSKCSSAMNIGI